MDGRRLVAARTQDRTLEPSAEPDRLRQEDVERWAQAIMAGLLAQAPPPRPVLPLGPPTPEGWRSDVGVLTEASVDGGSTAKAPVNLRSSAVGNSSGCDEDPVERLQIRVDVGESAETAFVVERRDNGLQILVASADPAMVKLLQTDQQAMVNALRASGQNISVLRVVAMDQVGTNLAQSGSQPVKRDRLGPHQAEEGRRPAEGRRKTRRINLTG